MNIGGLLPLSMIDFPGVPSAVVFTNGCNLRCPYCHNPELAKGEAPRIPEEEVKEFLRSRAGKLQGVVISGGEPFLQPDLLEFCRFCKDLGYKVKVDTNGTSMIHRGFTFILDYIAVDVKHFSEMSIPGFFKDYDFGEIDRNIRSFAYDMENMELRITCVRPFVYEEVLLGFLEYLRGEKMCDNQHPLYLQHCNVTPKILNPEFFESGKGKPWTQEEIYDFVEKYGKKYNVKAR